MKKDFHIMNKIQVSYPLVAVISFLAVIVTLFFAATDSKNTPGFSAGAIFFALVCAFGAYRFVKERRTL